MFYVVFVMGKVFLKFMLDGGEWGVRGNVV